MFSPDLENERNLRTRRNEDLEDLEKKDDMEDDDMDDDDDDSYSMVEVGSEMAPRIPRWVMNRPFLSFGFLDNPELSVQHRQLKHQQQIDINQLPTKVQELIVIEELLNAMMGFEGRYIKCVRDEKSQHVRFIFTQSEARDPSIAEITNRILPLCAHYVNISSFLHEYSKYQYGTVAHAFCAAIRFQLKQYLLFVGQLEHQHRMQKLSLQKIWSNVQGALRILSVLERVTTRAQVSKVRGGSLLRLIQEQSVILSGDDNTKKLFEILIEKASAPYFEILEGWLYRGTIHDPFHEFLVRECDPDLHEFTTGYWEKRYVMVLQDCPKFLEKLSNKILTTGKYLNVIRECNVDIRSPFADKLIYTPMEREYVLRIENAYHNASNELLKVVMQSFKLMDQLTSVKHYFLMDQGDFFVHIMDSAQQELEKKVNQIQSGRLNSLLEVAIRTSSIGSDQYKENISCSLLGYNLQSYLIQMNNVGTTMRENMEKLDQISQTLSISGIEAFVLNYHAEYPVSIVLNKQAITKYQLLFRHLFFCRYIEHTIGAAWGKGKFLREFCTGQAYNVMHMLRHRMLHFIQHFQYYIIEVVEKNHLIFTKKVRESVSTIDDVILIHNEFLDKCMRASLLSVNIQLYQTLNKIFSTSVSFSRFIIDHMRKLQYENAKYQSYTAQSQFSARRARVIYMHDQAQIAAQSTSFIKTVAKHRKQFDTSLVNLGTKLKSVSNQESGEQLNELIRLIELNVNTLNV